jgi:hypothetical protein
MTMENNTIGFYKLLLTLYPEAFRREFGPQMQQAFRDQLTDRAQCGERLGLGFWATIIADEVPSALTQQAVMLRLDGCQRTLLVFFPVLCVVFYAVLVTTALRLPHPPISGIGFVFAMAGLLTLAAFLSRLTLRTLVLR